MTCYCSIMIFVMGMSITFQAINAYKKLKNRVVLVVFAATAIFLTKMAEYGKIQSEVIL